MNQPRPALTGREAWALAAVMLLAIVLRLREAWGTPLWFDEIYIADVAAMPARAIVDLAARDIHPPLAFLMFGAWRSLFGDADFVLRIPALAIGFATVLVTWRLGRDAFGPAAALLAALLLALHPMHTRFSQEVEVHALLALLPVLLAALAWRWSMYGRVADAAAFTIVAVAALYTHYLLSLAVIAAAAWGLFASPDARARGRWALALAVVVVAFLPQVPVLLEQFRREGSGSFFHWPTPADLMRLAETAVPGGAHAVPAGLAIAAVALAVRRTRRAALLLMAVALLPILSRRLLPVIIPRDFIHLAPLGALLVAAGATAAPWPRWRPVLAGGLLVFAVRDVVKAKPFEEPRALARAADYIRGHAGSEDWIVHAETHALLFGTRYLPGFRNRLLTPAGGAVPFFEGGLVIPDSERLQPAAWDSLRSCRHWWGMRVDRAMVTRGVVSRAGTTAAGALDTASGRVLRRFGPVSVWEAPGVRDAAPAPARR